MSKKKAAANKKKTPVRAAKPVQPDNRIIVLKKKPDPGQVPEPVEKVIELLEEKGGTLPEADLLPAVEAKLPPEQAADVPTLWDYWRGRLEQMGILSVKQQSNAGR